MTQKIGYKSPPSHTKWQKGQSGNPSGRKKGNRNLSTDLAEEMAQIIHVVESGRPLRLTKQRALIKGLMARAIKGDAQATKLVLGMAMHALSPDEAANPVDVGADDEAMIAAFLARHMNTGDEK